MHNASLTEERYFMNQNEELTKKLRLKLREKEQAQQPASPPKR